MKKICVLLRGGLGNQLFQYAFGLSITKKFNLNIAFDDKYGFRKDKTYKRSVEISDIIKNKCNISDRIILIIFRILKFIIKKKIIFNSYICFALIDDSNYDFLHKVNFKKSKLIFIWAIGYFQDYKIDPIYLDFLKNEISKIPIIEDNFLNLFNNLNKVNSIAFCCRFYEEVSTENKYKHPQIDNRLMDKMLLRVKQICDNLNNPEIFYISTKNNINIVRKLKKYGNVKEITPEYCYNSAIGVLNLISLCNYKIITDSSLYFWGAVLGLDKNKLQNKNVFSVKSNKNKNNLSTSWREI